MSRILSFLRNQISFLLVLKLFLIYIILYFVVQGVELVIRGTSVEVFQPIIFLGVIAGWMLGRSSIKHWVIALITILGGILIALIRVSGIDTVIWYLTVSGFRVIWLKLIGKKAPDLESIRLLINEIPARLTVVLSSIYVTITDLLAGFTTYNQVSTLVFWGILLWCLAIWFAWITHRKYQPLWGLMPSGLLLAILMTYTLEKRILLVYLLGAGLILTGLINYEEKRIDWRNKGLSEPENIQVGFISIVMGVALVVMIISGLMPSIRINAIADPVERWFYGTGETEDPESEIELGGDERFAQELSGFSQFSGLPRQKLIGSGPEINQQVVMIVNFLSTSLDDQLPDAARYWRALSYDKYTGTGWQTSPTFQVPYYPGQEIFNIETEHFDIITQDIRLSNQLHGTLYSAGFPISLDQEVFVSWRTDPKNPSEVIDNSDILFGDIFAVTTESNLYQVRSLIPVVNEEDLRGATADYPDWIISRYLVLPESVPTRVIELANDITSQLESPYDKAKAIETYLREYPYTLDLPSPPLNRDIAEYFLFDLKTGYCDYYATSMVVLARAVGIPARITVGFVGGQLDQEKNQYLVTAGDAHTWPEVYFTGIGWIPFEPTPAVDLISDQPLSLPLPADLEEPGQIPEQEQPAVISYWKIGLSVSLILLVAIFSLDYLDLSRLRSMDGKDLAAALYSRLYRYSRWINLGHHKSDTLYEFEGKLSERLTNLSVGGWNKKRLTDGIRNLHDLTEFATENLFSQDHLGVKEKERFISVWRNLRIVMRYAVWINIWEGASRKVSWRGKGNQQQE